MSSEEGGKKNQDKKEEITITAPSQEWKQVQDLITSYRKQSRAMHHYTKTLELLSSFQRRLTQATGWKSPDDYFI